jgi:CheY-like chemotaxis protein/HPt (histidine-containing phosphotransfer) domain-containing protein/PAS domain-containing protein
LAILFLVSLAGLVARLAGMAAVGESVLVLALWLGATVLTGAGLAFLAAPRSMRGHSRNSGWDPPAANWGDVMDAVPTGFAVYDADARLVFCNKPWRRLFADVEGLAAVGSLYSDTVLQISGSRASGSPGASLTGERQLDGGTWVRFDESRLDGGGFLISVSDITKERARTSKAHAEREKSRLVISAAGAWIWETDVLHRISLAIPVRSELSRDELRWMIGRGLAELGSPAAADDDSALSKCIEDMQEHRRLDQVGLVLQDGERTRGVRLSGVPRIDDDGVFLGYCGVGIFDAVPAEVTAVIAPATSGRVIDPSDARGQRILLVDDSQTNRLLGVSILKKMGYDCDAVENGQQAVEAVRKGKYGLVLMDIRMPGMDGFEATAQIRNLPEPARSVPIVAMTAHVNAEDRQLCLESGMDDHVSKPVDRRVLSSVLRRLIGPPAADGADDGDGVPECTQTGGDGVPEGAHAGAADATLADNTTLEQLRDDAGPALVSELIASFMTETDERLLRMQTAMQSGDLDSVAAEAHAMKSSSGTFGALRLQLLVERLEAAANVNDASLASELLDGLPSLVAESWREFARAGYPPPE